MCGASYVCGIEIDREAIEVALKNRDEMLDEDGCSTLDIIQAAVETFEGPSRFDNFFDMVRGIQCIRSTMSQSS